MKKTLCILPLLVFLVSCHNSEDQKQIATLKQSCDSLKQSCDSLQVLCTNRTKMLTEARDSIAIYKYPADQRLAQIARYVEEEYYTEARKEIASLKSVFPMASEVDECEKYEKLMAQKEAEKQAEEERIKAMGFKAFKDNTTITYDEKTCAFSGFTYGRTYTFDSCSDVGEYSYDTADKNNTYILVSMQMSTKKNYASEPNLNVYEIVGDKMEEIASFRCEYASWTSYGAKIGNYSDDSHDFSKVNSVRYKMAAEISVEQSKKPLVIAVNTSGSYSRSCKLDEVKDNFIVVKILNRNKL